MQHYPLRSQMKSRNNSNKDTAALLIDINKNLIELWLVMREETIKVPCPPCSILLCLTKFLKTRFLQNIHWSLITGQASGNNGEGKLSQAQRY